MILDCHAAYLRKKLMVNITAKYSNLSKLTMEAQCIHLLPNTLHKSTQNVKYNLQKNHQIARKTLLEKNNANTTLMQND